MASESATTPAEGRFNGTAVRAGRLGVWLATPAAAVIIAVGTVLCWSTRYVVDYEMSLLPWLISRNWLLYRDAIDQHTPLLPTLLAWLGAGDPAALHYVIVALHLLILILTWLAARIIAGPVAALLAVIFTELWLISFDGTHLWYDIALAPFYLAIVALLCARTPLNNRRAALAVSLLAGLLLGLATLIKQHAILALPIVALVLYLLSKGNRKARLVALFAGFVLPILVAGAYYAANSALGDALYWTVAYTFDSDYVRLASLSPSASEWATLLLLYAPALAGLLMLITRTSRVPRTTLILLLGLIAVATFAAYPRYGRFHLAAAVPLLSVLAGTLLTDVGRTWRLGGEVTGPSSSRFTLHASRLVRSSLFRSAIIVLVVASFVGAGLLWLDAQKIASLSGRPEPPYSGTIAPLRNWVDAHAPPGASIAMYGLDPLLLRVLEREPTRPYIPLLRWIFFTRGREEQFWEGISAAQPAVALVSGTGWADSPQPGTATIESRLRYNYHEVARFPVVLLPGATPVQVVCLLRNESDGHSHHDHSNY